MLRGLAAAVAAFLVAGALAALVITVPLHAATGSGSGHLASAAKKKCKPKVPYATAAAAKKKKRCKKVWKNPPVVLPGETPVTPSVLSPRERARATWSTVNADVDLHIWDQSGNETYYANDGIPGGSHSGDAITAGSEVFTDELWYEPAPLGGNRNLSYGLCLRTAGPVTTNFSALLPNGVPFATSFALGQFSGQFVGGPGGYVPPNENDWCPN